MTSLAAINNSVIRVPDSFTDVKIPGIAGFACGCRHSLLQSFKIGQSVHVLRHDVSGVVESRNIRMAGISYLVRFVRDGIVQSS
jgi:hypothetical protein